MILYHFTSLQALPSIRRVGLQGLMVVDYGNLDRGWISMTTSERPEGLGINLEDERPTDDERWEHFLITKRTLPPDHLIWNKAAVRIRLKIPRTDHRLIPWAKYQHRVEPVRLGNMHKGEKPETWWMYRGSIPAEKFHAVHFRHGTEYREDEPHERS